MRTGRGGSLGKVRLNKSAETILIEVAVRKPDARHMQLFEIVVVNAYELCIRLALRRHAAQPTPAARGTDGHPYRISGQVREIVGHRRRSRSAASGACALMSAWVTGSTAMVSDWLAMMAVNGEPPEVRDVIMRKFMETFSIATK